MSERSAQIGGADLKHHEPCPGFRLKAVLKLTGGQQQLWPAIERAFREISQAQEAGGSQGFVQGVKNKWRPSVSTRWHMRRLASAAYPLLRTLTEEQKQSGLSFARSTGLDRIAAAF